MEKQRNLPHESRLGSRISRREFLVRAGIATTAVAVGRRQEAAAAQIPVGSKARYGGHLLVGQMVDATGLDPHKTQSFASHQYYELVYSGLTKFSERLEVEPDLATSWKTPNDRTYIFYLGKGVKWHNGREFVADDVKYSLERVLDPKTGSPWRSHIDAIDGIEVVDQHTVRISLKYPFASLLPYLANLYGTAIVPREVVEKHGDLNTVAVGTGPFKMPDYILGRRAKYEKNKDYYIQGLPYLEGITYQLITEEAARLAAARTGTVDFTTVSAQSAKLLSGRKDLIVLRSPSLILGQLIPNCTRKPFDDVRVRRAMHFALDRQEIINAAFFGEGVPTAPIPTGSGWDLPAVEIASLYRQDLDKGKQLLKEAGFPGGFKTTLKTSPGQPEDVAASIVIQSQLASIGIQAEIIKLEWATFIKETFTENNYDLKVVASRWSADPDLYVHGYFHSKSTRNRSQFFTGELDELADRGRRTLDVQERKRIYHQAQRKIIELSPVIYTSTSFNFEVIKPSLKGYRPTPGMYRFPLAQAWIES